MWRMQPSPGDQSHVKALDWAAESCYNGFEQLTEGNRSIPCRECCQGGGPLHQSTRQSHSLGHASPFRSPEDGPPGKRMCSSKSSSAEFPRPYQQASQYQHPWSMALAGGRWFLRFRGSLITAEFGRGSVLKWDPVGVAGEPCACPSHSAETGVEHPVLARRWASSGQRSWSGGRSRWRSINAIEHTEEPNSPSM